MADLSALFSQILGLACLVGLFFFRRSAAIPKWFTALVLVLALVVAATMGATANFGGQIRHTEIR